MAIGGPIYFFQQDETEYVRRRRKSYSIIETLEEENAQSKQEPGNTDKGQTGDTQSIARPETAHEHEQCHVSRLELYNQTLISKIEEDAKYFTDNDSLNLPSLHKFLPLLKQAILTFDEIDPPPTAYVSLHEKYQALKLNSAEILEDLINVFEDLSNTNTSISQSMIPEGAREIFRSNFRTLVLDTEVEYREWQRGTPPHPTTSTGGKITSQVSELTYSLDGSRSGKSRYGRKPKGMWSSAEDEGGTSSRSNEGTFGGMRSARRESARRRNHMSDQSDIIEDLYLESAQQSDVGSKYAREKAGTRRKEMESLYEIPPHNTTINFSLTNKNCTAKGWVIDQGNRELKDKSLVKYLLERLQKCKMNRLNEEKSLKQQGYPSLLKYYTEFESEPYKSKRPFSWSGRHKVGFVTEVPQDTKSQFIFAFPDGSTTIYYPSGAICCIISRCQLPKEQEFTRTINVFHHDQSEFIIASFNPSGVGSCWYENKTPAFLSTLLGGCIYNEHGLASKSWSWNNIDIEDFLMPINVFLSLYFTANGEIYLHLQLSQECILINAKTSKPAAEETPQPIPPTLVSGEQFKSNAAQAILNAPKTRGRRRLRQKRVSSTRVTDDSETEEILYPYKHSIADPTDRYLINTSKKIVKNVEEFLLHFRQELSLGKTSKTSHDLKSPKSQRNTASDTTKLATTDSEIALSRLPAGFKFVSGGCCKRKYCIRINLNNLPYLVFPERLSKKKNWKHRSSSANSRVMSPRRRFSCPLALQTFLSTNEEVLCKCDWRVIPRITDYEFDKFMTEKSKQLLVVSVYSSKFPEATPCDGMIEEIYYGLNYSRSQPCTQAIQDKYRLLKYDISTNKILSNRHNAVPGMFFIYSKSKLVFADLVFNGYSNAKKDFLKQIYKCMKLVEESKFLPADFKFTGLRSWEEADDSVRQILTLQFGRTSGWIAPKLTPLTRKEDLAHIGVFS